LNKLLGISYLEVEKLVFYNINEQLKTFIDNAYRYILRGFIMREGSKL